METSRTFLEFLQDGRERGGFETDDVLAAVLPLMEQVHRTHEEGFVAPLEGVGSIVSDQTRLSFDDTQRRKARKSPLRLAVIQKPVSAAVDVVGETRQTADLDSLSHQVENLTVGQMGQEITKPVYLPGYVSWEHSLDHHDQLTDIYSLGLILASLACHLDFTDRQEFHDFVSRRENLFALNARLNPVLAATIVRMTELDRHRRSQDLASDIVRLRNYREQTVDTEFDVNQIKGFRDGTATDKRQSIQGHLRNRLFEITRRNRLIYFKPTLQTLNLTLASVPLMLDYQRIQPEQLFFLRPGLAKELADGSTLNLGNYLRFEDAPYLPGVLDRVISEARRDRAEFGFAQLRLVLCFLRWNNLKESPDERIHSPLLLLPVELTKKKAVRDVYQLRSTTHEAEVNPALRHHLHELYGLKLPETVDLHETTLDAFHESLQKQIQASEPGVNLIKIERPQIKLIHDRARQRLDQYRRRLRLTGRGVRQKGAVEYSYDRSNYQPLGLQLFLRTVKPSPAPLGLAAGGKSRPRTPQMMEGAGPVPAPGSADDKAVVSEKDASLYALHESQGANPYAWDFDLCSLTLGNFNYRKMSLVRDYTQLLEGDLASTAFDTIFSLQPRPAENSEKPALPIEDQFLTVSCDPTQTSAIAHARDGRSYIIQGPPGTGKSQTITNLIADYAARGKRVLFVCEKRAAIDVVFHRLQQCGLDDLCCLIHDSQTDKKEFVLNLKHTYEGFLKEGDGAAAADAKRNELVRLINQDLGVLQRFADAMQTVHDGAGLPLRQILQRLIELRRDQPALSLVETEQIPAYDHWVAHGAVIQHLAATLRDLGEEPIFARHPLRCLNPAVVDGENPIATLVAHLDKAEAILTPLEKALSQSKLPGEVWNRLDQIEALVTFATRIKPLAKWNLLVLLNPESERARRFAAGVRDLAAKATALEQAQKAAAGWRERLPAADIPAALSQAQSFANSWFSRLKPAYWRLRKILLARYDFSSHVIAPGWVQILQALDAAIRAETAYGEAYGQFEQEFGVDNVGDASRFAAELPAILESLHPSAKSLCDYLIGNPGAVALVQTLAGLGPEFHQLDAELSATFIDYRSESLLSLREWVDDVRENLSSLPDLIPCLRELGALPERLQQVLRRQPLTPRQLEAAMARQSLNETYRKDRLISQFEGRSLLQRLERLDNHYNEWMKRNAECIRARVRAKFLQHVQISSAPAAQLTAEQKNFKRLYATGRRELEHEFSKTMRYRSIRDLANDETGLVIRDIKPIWLMSPLSVSDAIPLDPAEFDVVIFDEASQIPLEEAIPAVYRSHQVIVVGDEMQLPPTNFFSASRLDEDSVLVEEEGEAVTLDLAADSFLTMAARNLPATFLGWHYRSRYESLISFSNASFYSGQLLTIPDRQLSPVALPEIKVASPAEGAANVEHLLNRSISYHHLEQGVYSERCNTSEARYIAEMVRNLLRRETKLSIGIVAFSEAQQTEIETALTELGREDADFRNRLEAEFEREEDGQFCGLIVKNLENVQGDERDIIILSVCYGYDAGKRMLMNFGPINQRGGEKRLNVIFSRARRHMGVVSSIRHFDITNEYNDGAACLRNYLEYAAAVSVADGRTASRLLAGLAPQVGGRETARPVDPVVDEIAAALRKHGHQVDTDIGQSGFRCHLAVRDAGQAFYRLGILVDTDESYRNTDPLERCLLRPKVLERFDWRVMLVLTKDWYHDPDDVLRQLNRVLSGQAPEPTALEDLVVEPEPAPVAPVAAPVVVVPPAPTAPENFPADAKRRYFEFVGGASRKFWEIAVAENRFAVRYGRLGTTGQEQEKTFGSAEAAQREADRLIAEKLGKGYTEKTPPARA